MKPKAAFLLASTVLALSTAAQAQPNISQVIVAPIGGGNIEMVIKGSGFGTASPFTNDSPNIRISDNSTTPTWEAGYQAPGAWFKDLVTVEVTSWTDTEIDIAGFSGSYNQYVGYHFNSGDTVEVQVQKPGTQNSWATYYKPLSQAFLEIEIVPPQYTVTGGGQPILLDDTEMTSLLNEIEAQLSQQGLNPTSFAVTVVPNTSGNLDIFLVDILMEAPLDVAEAATDFPELGVWGVSTELGEDAAFWITPSPLDILNAELSGIVYAIDSAQASLVQTHGCWHHVDGTEQPITDIPYVVQCDQELKIVVTLSSIPPNGTTIDLSCVLGNFLYGYLPTCDFSPVATECGVNSGEYVPVQETTFNNTANPAWPTFDKHYVMDLLGNTISGVTVVTPSLSSPCYPVTINTSSIGIEGMTSGSTNVIAGTSVTVSATPDAGYVFANWTENGFIVTNTPTYTFTANGSHNLVANFLLALGQWTQTGAPNENWMSVASSADGTKLVAEAYGGEIYTSADSGATWSQVSTLSSSSWTIIASSADGTKLVAAVKFGGIYTSTDSGATWTQTSAPTEEWLSCVSSSDGTKLGAWACPNGLVPGFGFFTSTDSGVTWTQTSADYFDCFLSVASSSNLTKLVAASQFGPVYISTDSGATWTQTSVPNTCVFAVASSADGTKLAAAERFCDGIFYTSTDSGATWAQISAPNENWNTVASSADGTKVVAAVGGGGIYAFLTAPTTTWTITMAASPTASGSTSSNGIVNNGSSVTVCATPNPCYSFVNWTENGSIVSTSACYTFTADSSHSFVANFTPTIYSISTSSFSSGGSTKVGGAVNCGSSTTVTATANDGYQFVNWTENGSIVSASPSYTFTPTGSGTLIANFLPITYAVNAGASPSNGGTVTGGGIVNSGASLTLMAMPNIGCSFLNWTESGIVVYSFTNYTFTVTGNRALVANFTSPPSFTLGFGPATPWTSNGFSFMFQGPTGFDYSIEASTDLFNWLPLTNFTSTNSPFFFSDPSATNYPQRFYRAVMQ